MHDAETDILSAKNLDAKIYSQKKKKIKKIKKKKKKIKKKL